MKKVALVLAGCGVYDGSEIHEATAVLLAIDRAGAEAVCMAPNRDQMHVVNHLSGEASGGETRNDGTPLGQHMNRRPVLGVGLPLGIASRPAE